MQQLASGEPDYEWMFTTELDIDQRQEVALAEVDMALSRMKLPNTEEILLWLNARISLHGKSYGLPLLWLLVTTGLFGLQQANWPHRWVAMTAGLADWLGPIASLLNGWAKGLVFLNLSSPSLKSKNR